MSEMVWVNAYSTVRIGPKINVDCLAKSASLTVSPLFDRICRLVVPPPPTSAPNETFHWGITGGDTIQTFDTDCGKIGVVICYDVEFPELSRLMADEGMNILFVPFLTDTQNGYTRVKHCAQARAIENQCYVVGVNRVGIDANNLVYSGDCTFTDVLGNKQTLKNNLEEIATFVINLTDLNKIREMLPFLNDR